jgi:hypothetical protein
MSSPSETVATYILAKDGNRPYLMRQAFTGHAELEMVVKTDAISFPSSAQGLHAIEDVLIRRFGLEYENVYTFCLSRPSETDRQFSCQWLVGMSAKSNGQIRIGCGRYDWYFESKPPCRAERLVITIDVMKIFPAAELVASMNWLSGLSYPWCTAEEAVRNLPSIEGLGEIETYLKQVNPISSGG